MKNSAGFSLGNIKKIMLAKRKKQEGKRCPRAPRTPAGFSLGKIKKIKVRRLKDKGESRASYSMKTTEKIFTLKFSKNRFRKDK